MHETKGFPSPRSGLNRSSAHGFSQSYVPATVPRVAKPKAETPVAEIGLRGGLKCLLSWWLLVLLATVPLAAQEPPRATDDEDTAVTATAEETAGLGEASEVNEQPLEAPPRSDLNVLEEHFNVLSTANGIGLTPKETQSYSLVEVQQGTVAVDGEVVDEARLIELLGQEDAARLIALTQLSGAELRSLRRPLSSDLEDRLERIAELQAQRDRELVELEALRAELESAEPSIEEEDDESGRYYTQDRFSFGNSLTIDARESTNDVVVIGGSLEVNGEVVGDAVVVGGGVEVNGHIHGDLTAVGGSIDIGPEATINGEVTSVGGSIYDPHNRVRGGSVQVDLGPFDGFDNIFGGGGWDNDDWRRHGPSWGWHWGGIIFSIIGLVIFALWILFLTFLNRDYVHKIAQRTELEPWKAALVGLVSQILLFPLVAVISLVLLVSVIGIPLLFIFLPLGAIVLGIFFCYGYAGVASWFGRFLERRFDWRQQGPFAVVLLGILLIEGWALLGEALSGFGGPIQISAWLVLILGFFLQYLAWTTGFGSVVLMAFERRGRALPGGRSPGMVPPPPPPGGGPAGARSAGEPADLLLPEEGYGTSKDDDYAPAYGPEESWQDPFAEPSDDEAPDLAGPSTGEGGAADRVEDSDLDEPDGGDRDDGDRDDGDRDEGDPGGGTSVHQDPDDEVSDDEVPDDEVSDGEDPDEEDPGDKDPDREDRDAKP